MDQALSEDNAAVKGDKFVLSWNLHSKFISLLFTVLPQE